MNTIQLKYYTKKRVNDEIVYVCTNDHKCSLKGCAFNLDIPDAQIITIPFDYTKKWSYVEGYRGRYHIRYNFINKTFKQYTEYTNQTIGDVHTRSTNLNEQITFKNWLPMNI